MISQQSVTVSVTTINVTQSSGNAGNARAISLCSCPQTTAISRRFDVIHRPHDGNVASYRNKNDRNDEEDRTVRHGKGVDAQKLRERKAPSSAADSCIRSLSFVERGD